MNLFGVGTMIAELMESGGFTYYHRFEPMNLLGSLTGTALFLLACKVIYLIFIIFFIVKEVRTFWKNRCKYLTMFWSWVEIQVITLSIAGTVIYVYRYVATLKLLDIFAKSGGNAYMKFQEVAYWNEVLLYMLGLLVFWSTMKFIKLLRFNKVMSLLGSTLKYASTSLFYFSIMFLLLFFAFVHFFYLTYNSLFRTFSTLVLTTEECLQMLVGKFEFNVSRGCRCVIIKMRRRLLPMFRGLCVCVFVIAVSCAKTAEPIEMPFGLWNQSGQGAVFMEGGIFRLTVKRRKEYPASSGYW